MQRVDLYPKVELHVDVKSDPAKLAAEIWRQLIKSYGVRRAEVSNIVERE